jgi:hypothetical protein
MRLFSLKQATSVVILAGAFVSTGAALTGAGETASEDSALTIPAAAESLATAGIRDSIQLAQGPLGTGIAGKHDPATNGFVPNDHPTLHVPPARETIVIDGDLSDPAWQHAGRALNFAENFPGESTEPPVKTEAWVTYDEANLYLAFVAYDDDPSSIRASLRDRDQIFQDDFVGIMLDTYGDASWAYEIFSNPLGVQGDLRWSRGIEDERFDIVYHTEGKITEQGYQVEMAIPFSSLRFPNKPQQEWRATFWRTHPRSSRAQYTWAATDRDESCWPCQWGTLSGITNVKPGSKLDLMPGVTASQNSFRTDSEDPFASIEDESVDADLSLNVRYAFSTALTGEGTINPDFSQIESDVAQIDVNTTFALFFPERRPFFQEGGDILDSYADVIYTRSINDPLGAARLTGRMSRTGFAYIGARDQTSAVLLPFEEFSSLAEIGQTYTNIFRLKQNILEDSHLGLQATDRRYDIGGGGSLGGLDGRIRFLDKYALSFQGMVSHTNEPWASHLTDEDLAGETFDNGRYTATFDGEQFWGHGAYANLGRDARHWRFDLGYREYSPTFRADNGFVTQNNFRRVAFWTGYMIQPENPGLLVRLQPQLSMGRQWNFNGLRKDEWLQPQFWMELKGQNQIWMGYLFSAENFSGVEIPGIRRLQFNFNTDFSDPLRFGFFVSTGTQIARNEEPVVLGDGTNFELWATIKPMQQLVFQPLLNYSKLTYQNGGPEIFNGYIFRLRTQFQFSRPLFFRLIFQYDEFDDILTVDPLLSYKLNPFSVAFIGSSHNYQDLDGKPGFQQQDRQIFFKVQYLFQM